jgi:hypothetical protein
MATPVTASPCPVRVSSSPPARASQTFAVRSLLPDTMRRPYFPPTYQTLTSN